MTSISRARAGAFGALLLAGIVALTACGAGTEEEPPAAGHGSDAGTSSLLPAAEGRTAYPLTLDTPWGSTELEERPERVAAVTPSQDDAEILAALGVTPIIASEWATDVWLEEALPQPVPERFTTGDTQFPVEQIAAADPDLIVVLGADLSDDYAKLSAIAPVLGTAEQGGSEQSVANDWATSILRVGEVLDLQGAAQRVLDDEEEFFAGFREEHPEIQGLTATYVVYYGEEGGLQYHSSAGSPAASVLERMGFAPNPNAGELSYRQEVSEELLSAIDADVILFSDNSDGAYATITEQPLFQSLQAVQDDHLVLIDNRAAENAFVIDDVEYEGNLPWALARSGPLSGTWAVDQLAPALAAAVQR
jgi:iron complex transport system substrate-binding protein